MKKRKVLNQLLNKASLSYMQNSKFAFLSSKQQTRGEHLLKEMCNQNLNSIYRSLPASLVEMDKSTRAGC